MTTLPDLPYALRRWPWPVRVAVWVVCGVVAVVAIWAIVKK